MDHYLPVVFSPPRDGTALTEPLPIAGNNKLQGIIIPMMSITIDPNGVPNCDEMEGEDRASVCEDVHSSSQSGGVGDDDTSEVGGVSPAPF